MFQLLIFDKHPLKLSINDLLEKTYNNTLFVEYKHKIITTKYDMKNELVKKKCEKK